MTQFKWIDGFYCGKRRDFRQISMKNSKFWMIWCKWTNLFRFFVCLLFSHSSMVKKWQTLIEANLDVRTTDGYLLRVFAIGFTTKDQMSQRKTCYAQHSQVRAIRKKMNDIITRDVTSSDLKEVVNKLVPDSIAKDIEKACHGIYPLHDVHIRKVCTSMAFIYSFIWWCGTFVMICFVSLVVCIRQ